ncbi:hypothetical protein, partial [Tenacibaculum agarivorans]|uniref:hypothetical protein n=1 Tax=Tenacibaculum agarivorans TaxID=1908389 RepID=UPI000B07EEA5
MKIKNLCILLCVLIAQCVFAQTPSERPVDPLDPSEPSGPGIPAEPVPVPPGEFDPFIIPIGIDPCDCPGNTDKPSDFRFNFNDSFNTALANDRAAIAAALEKERAWYDRQTKLITGVINGRLRENYTNYTDARKAYF